MGRFNTRSRTSKGGSVEQSDLFERVTGRRVYPHNVGVESMRIGRTLAAAALIGATAVGFAGPASAALVGGTYTVAVSGFSHYGNAPTLWAVERCGVDCAKISDGRGTIWDAQLANGKWTASRHSETAVSCMNGYFAPGTSVFTIDDQTLKGTIVSTSDGPACGSPAPITAATILVSMHFS